eukprot:scaffold3315_cov98-Cylindrotheca_fusiformis.AAC.2
MEQLEQEDDFKIIDSVEWGDETTTTDVEELAAKPKQNRSADDPCNCYSYNGEMVCNDLSCVLFACQEECRSNCKAGPYCGNKRIQKKQWKQFRVINAGKKGRGLELLEDVVKGDLITEYCGRAINKKFLPRLFQRYGNERKLYIMALDKDIYLDARSTGSLARYINHSCEPNCVVERWKVKGIIRAIVVAKQDMAAGTELSFDYQWERKRGRAPTKCHCQSLSCRGTLEIPRSMEEQALEKRLNDHWKKPFMMRPKKEIVNRCVRILSQTTQEYFTGDVTSYDPTTGKHLIMYRHDLEEVWEDLKSEDWMILDEEAQQFIIRKKTTQSQQEQSQQQQSHHSSSMLLPNVLLQGGQQHTKNYLYVQTNIKDALQRNHLFERCQRSCRVTITTEQCTNNNTTDEGLLDEMEQQERSNAFASSIDGTIWKLTIVGYDIAKAHAILERNVAFVGRKLMAEANAIIANNNANGGGGEQQNGGSSSLYNGSINNMNNGGSTNNNLLTESNNNGTAAAAADVISSEVILPRSIVDAVKKRLPMLRVACRNITITFWPSESKSKQFAKLVIEGTLQSDVDVAKGHLWQHLNNACQEQNAPMTPSGVYKNLCFLGGQMTSRDFFNLLEYGKTDMATATATGTATTTTTSTATTGQKRSRNNSNINNSSNGSNNKNNNNNNSPHDAKEDLTRWSPFFASFESCQRCTIWVQSDADKGRINSANQIVNEATPSAPRKIYFGCAPGRVPTLWEKVQQRANEVGRGVKYLYLGSDQLYQPMMMKDNGKFFQFVRNVTGADVTVDAMTGDHLRIDGKAGFPPANGGGEQSSNVVSSEGDRAALAEELVRLQIELYRDRCIREQNWIFGRDWALAAKKASGNSNGSNTMLSSSSSSSSGGSGRSVTPAPSRSAVSFDSKTLLNACIEVAEILAALKMNGTVAAHAVVIMYRFSVLQKDTQLKIREILLAAIFIANKAQKYKRWKPLEYVLEAAYASFYPGVKFDAKMEEVLVWEEKVIAAEEEVLQCLDYDVFWRGFDWIEVCAVQSAGMSRSMARKAVAFCVSGPILAVGSELWLGYGPDHVFAAAAGFLGADLEPIFSAFSLIPLKVMQVVEMIATSIKDIGMKQFSLLGFQNKEKLLKRQAPIVTACTRSMATFTVKRQTHKLSESQQRYRIIGDSIRKRLVFRSVPASTVKDAVLPFLDGVSAESNCNIYLEQGTTAGLFNIVLEGSWRALSIASYLLQESVQGASQLPQPEEVRSESESVHNIQAKGDPGLLLMNDIETVDAWKGTIQSEITSQSSWGRKTGGKCCIPAKIKEADLRHAGLRWWLPPRYGPNPTGSICDMFLVNNDSSNTLQSLGNLTVAFQGKSAAFPMLTSSQARNVGPTNGNSTDRFVAVSVQRWPSDKVAKREQQSGEPLKKSSDTESKRKDSEVLTMKMGFSAGALQEVQLLHKLHGLVNSPQGHPNFVLPVGVALSSEVESDDIGLTTNGSKSVDMKSINADIEDIFSLTRTSLENELAAQNERKRKESVTGPHLVFHATPFVLQRFCNMKKKRKQLVSQNILAAWFHDLLSAMLHCHSNDIVMRNFQGDQIVVDHSGVAKFAGFYRATVLSQEDKKAKFTDCIKRRHSRKKDAVDVSTNPYTAPEMLLGSPKYTKETDIWTLGCLFAHLLLSRPMYTAEDTDSALTAMYKIIGTPSSESLPEAVKFPNFRRPAKKYVPGVSKALQTMLGDEDREVTSAIDLIDKMLQLDPRKRITAVGALQHEFMQDYTEQCTSQEYRDNFVNDWMSLKNSLMRPNETDELKQRERGIKRKAMLMAASKTPAGGGDDLYDMDDLLGDPATKVPKL